MEMISTAAVDMGAMEEVMEAMEEVMGTMDMEDMVATAAMEVSFK